MVFLANVGKIDVADLIIRVKTDEQGTVADAAAFFREALALFLEIGHRRGAARVLEGMAGVASRRGDAARALTLAGAASALRHELGAPPRPRDKERLDAALAPARAELGPAAAGDMWGAGARMSLADAIAFVRDSERPAGSGVVQRIDQVPDRGDAIGGQRS